MTRKVEIGPDAATTNCLRIKVDGEQWCKVYGWSPEQAKARADEIAAALSRAPEAGREGAADERLAIVAEKPAHLIRWGEGDRLDLQSVLAALSPPSTGGAGRASVWLIEWPASRQEPVRYWHPTEGHVIDPNHAVRFCRREDAEAMLKRDGLHAGAKAVEHVYLHPSPEMGEISAEDIAQFLHDEVDLPDKVVSGQWPLHDNDDGYRGDSGYVRLQPRDIVEHYRDAGKRLHRLILSKLKENGLSREDKAT